MRKYELWDDGHTWSYQEESNVFNCISRKWEWGVNEVNLPVNEKARWLRDGIMAWSCQRGGSIIDTR